MKDNNRSSGQCRIESDENILQLALSLHMYSKGSFPELSEPDKVYEDLLEVAKHWKPTGNKFDKKVFELICSVLDEFVDNCYGC